MKYVLGLLGLISINCYSSDDVFGHFEVGRYWSTNIPSYTDQTGAPLEYRVDMEINFPMLYQYVIFMVGADGVTGDTYFTQGAGRAGLTLDLGRLELSVYHRSLHNFDHESTSGQRFLNDNRMSIKYRFGSRK